MKQFHLSRTVAYAVQATIHLAESDFSRPVPCSRLAKEGNMPERFLLQILRSLVTHGILKSTRGVDGGYTLTRPPREISLLDVIEAIEGPFSSGVAEVGQQPAPTAQQKLSEALQEVATSARQQLEAIKFSQLIEPPKS